MSGTSRPSSDKSRKFFVRSGSVHIASAIMSAFNAGIGLIHPRRIKPLDMRYLPVGDDLKIGSVRYLYLSRVALAFSYRRKYERYLVKADLVTNPALVFASDTSTVHVVFALETRTQTGLASTPTDERPCSLLSKSVVPVPQNGSKTVDRWSRGNRSSNLAAKSASNARGNE